MLTEAMEIAPPSLYAAFGGKAQLFDEAVDLYGRTTGDFSRRALEGEATAREAVESLLFGAARAFTENRARLGCPVVSAGSTCSPEAGAIERAMRRRRIASEEALRMRLVKGVEDGDLPKSTDTAELAKLYASVFQGMSVQARDGASRQDLERVAVLALRSWPVTESRAVRGSAASSGRAR